MKEGVIKTLLEGLDEETKIKVLTGVIERLVTKEHVTGTEPVFSLPVSQVARVVASGYKVPKKKWQKLQTAEKEAFLRSGLSVGRSFADMARDIKANSTAITAFAKYHEIRRGRKGSRTLALGPNEADQFEV